MFDDDSKVEEAFLSAVEDFIDSDDGRAWRERAKSLRDRAREQGQETALIELISWYGGDLDNIEE